ncbi:MAG: hypothetical protein FWF84_04865, partial [Kiritimatiellaeota bacterium]|nr:hypothetical protein [Kiritimatiellota bacterium]
MKKIVRLTVCVIVGIIAGYFVGIALRQKGICLFEAVSIVRDREEEVGAALEGVVTPTPEAGVQQGTEAPRVVANAPDEESWDDEEDDPPTPEERAVKRWEEVIETFTTEISPISIVGAGGDDGDDGDDEDEEDTLYPEVTDADRRRARELFNAMTEEHRLEEVQHAMNLLPDETVSIMYEILFDKEQDEDIIDIIFSDLLNRDEEIKNPVIEEIVKDPEHPMFEEASRILEITRDDDDDDDDD